MASLFDSGTDPQALPKSPLERWLEDNMIYKHGKTIVNTNAALINRIPLVRALNEEVFGTDFIPVAPDIPEINTDDFSFWERMFPEIAEHRRANRPAQTPVVPNPELIEQMFVPPAPYTPFYQGHSPIEPEAPERNIVDMVMDRESQIPMPKFQITPRAVERRKQEAAAAKAKEEEFRKMMAIQPEPEIDDIPFFDIPQEEDKVSYEVSIFDQSGYSADDLKDLLSRTRRRREIADLASIGAGLSAMQTATGTDLSPPHIPSEQDIPFFDAITPMAEATTREMGSMYSAAARSLIESGLGDLVPGLIADVERGIADVNMRAGAELGSQMMQHGVAKAQLKQGHEQMKSQIINEFKNRSDVKKMLDAENRAEFIRTLGPFAQRWGQRLSEEEMQGIYLDIMKERMDAEQLAGWFKGGSRYTSGDDVSKRLSEVEKRLNEISR